MGSRRGIIHIARLRRMNPPERLEQLRQTVPLLRTGGAEEIVRVLSFAACDDAACFSGEIVAVNGGMRMD